MTTEALLADIPLSTATAAHRGTSWTPETRGQSQRTEYAQTLAADYAEFAAIAAQKPELAPTIGAWQAYRNQHAIDTARKEAGV